MSKERELLKRWLDNHRQIYKQGKLLKETKELLAQLEQDSITDATPMACMPNGSTVSNVYEAYEEGRKSVMFEQEPVAWMYDWDDEHERTRINLLTTDKEHTHLKTAFNIQPLYTSLPAREPSASAREMYQRGYAKAELGLKREPLREDQIFMERNTLNCFEYRDGFVDGVKFAEKAHGIGECNSHYKERHETFGEEV